MSNPNTNTAAAARSRSKPFCVDSFQDDLDSENGSFDWPQDQSFQGDYSPPKVEYKYGNHAQLAARDKLTDKRGGRTILKAAPGKKSSVSTTSSSNNYRNDNNNNVYEHVPLKVVPPPSNYDHLKPPPAPTANDLGIDTAVGIEERVVGGGELDDSVLQGFRRHEYNLQQSAVKPRYRPTSSNNGVNSNYMNKFGLSPIPEGPEFDNSLNISNDNINVATAAKDISSTPMKHSMNNYNSNNNNINSDENNLQDEYLRDKAGYRYDLMISTAKPRQRPPLNISQSSFLDYQNNVDNIEIENEVRTNTNYYNENGNGNGNGLPETPLVSSRSNLGRSTSNSNNAYPHPNTLADNNSNQQIRGEESLMGGGPVQDNILNQYRGHNYDLQMSTIKPRHVVDLENISLINLDQTIDLIPDAPPVIPIHEPIIPTEPIFQLGNVLEEVTNVSAPVNVSRISMNNSKNSMHGSSHRPISISSTPQQQPQYQQPADLPPAMPTPMAPTVIPYDIKNSPPPDVYLKTVSQSSLKNRSGENRSALNINNTNNLSTILAPNDNNRSVIDNQMNNSIRFSNQVLSDSVLGSLIPPARTSVNKLSNSSTIKMSSNSVQPRQSQNIMKSPDKASSNARRANISNDIGAPTSSTSSSAPKPPVFRPLSDSPYQIHKLAASRIESEPLNVPINQNDLLHSHHDVLNSAHLQESNSNINVMASQQAQAQHRQSRQQSSRIEAEQPVRQQNIQFEQIQQEPAIMQNIQPNISENLNLRLSQHNYASHPPVPTPQVRPESNLSQSAYNANVSKHQNATKSPSRDQYFARNHEHVNVPIYSNSPIPPKSSVKSNFVETREPRQIPLVNYAPETSNVYRNYNLPLHHDPIPASYNYHRIDEFQPKFQFDGDLNVLRQRYMNGEISLELFHALEDNLREVSSNDSRALEVPSKPVAPEPSIDLSILKAFINSLKIAGDSNVEVKTEIEKPKESRASNIKIFKDMNTSISDMHEYVSLNVGTQCNSSNFDRVQDHSTSMTTSEVSEEESFESASQITEVSVSSSVFEVLQNSNSPIKSPKRKTTTHATPPIFQQSQRHFTRSEPDVHVTRSRPHMNYEHVEVEAISIYPGEQIILDLINLTIPSSDISDSLNLEGGFTISIPASSVSTTIVLRPTNELKLSRNKILLRGGQAESIKVFAEIVSRKKEILAAVKPSLIGEIELISQDRSIKVIKVFARPVPRTTASPKTNVVFLPIESANSELNPSSDNSNDDIDDSVSLQNQSLNEAPKPSKRQFAGEVTFSKSFYDFGSVQMNTFAKMKLKIVNPTNHYIQISIGRARAPFKSNPTTISLGPQQSVKFPVMFYPHLSNSSKTNNNSSNNPHVSRQQLTVTIAFPDGTESDISTIIMGTAY